VLHKDTDPSWAEWRAERDTTCLSQAEYQSTMEAFDHIHSAVQYLAHSWGIDTPPKEMEVNLISQALLINLESTIITTAERRLAASA
jgi:hypothetical protein